MENTFGNIAGLFTAVRDAVIGVRDGKIAFMNPAAEGYFGRGLTGSAASRVLPGNVLGSESGSVLASAELGGRAFVITSVRFGDTDVFYLTCPETQTGAGLGEHAEYTIRTLLADMKLATDRIRAYLEENGDERAKTEGAVLDHSCHRMRRLLMNLAAEDAIVRGSLPQIPRSTDMEVLCGDVTDTTAYFAEKRGISVGFECRTKNHFVEIDRELAEKMLLILLLNSLLRSESGGSVTVTLTELGDNLVLSVDDTGAAIKTGQLASLFDGPHSRAGDVGRDDGMGLSLAKTVAESFGGSLLIESTAAKTTAKVMLPAEKNPPADLREIAAPYRASGMETVLTQLSPWLRSSDYDMKYRD